MKRKEPRPIFELMPLIPFPPSITIILSTPPSGFYYMLSRWDVKQLLFLVMSTMH